MIIKLHTQVIANMQDILIKNKREIPCLLIDVAIPDDRNVTQMGAERQ